jgi:hypothetical protein
LAVKDEWRWIGNKDIRIEYGSRSILDRHPSGNGR